MQVGDLVWARWLDNCFGIVIDVVFETADIEPCYRIKWWWTGYDHGTHITLEYIEDLVTKEEKCSKQEI